jgi:hypothetical protein
MPELQRQPHDLNDYTILGRNLDKSHSVLVLEFNPETIDPILSGTANQLPNLHANLIHTDVLTISSEFEYQTRLSELKAAQMQYALVVVLGDGNSNRLKLNDNRALTWTEFTYQSLLPFEPESLLLLSTASEREIPAHTFFEAVPMLKEVYSTTVSDTKLQTDVLKFMVSYLVNPAPSEYDRIFGQQIADKLLNSGVLTRWTWRDSLKQRVLSTFEMLNESEKLEVAAEIIRRTAQSSNSRFSSTTPTTT